MLVELLAFLLVLAWMAVAATACEGVGGPELTTLTTSLSGEGKEGVTITVLEGSKVKDKATLKGKNASSATGKVTYKVYSESECKTLVKEAGEATVSGESVPASSEVELEGGATYYWQAHYSGDSKNGASTSECTEIVTVKAKTSLSTKLSGESKEGEELTVLEGSKAKDKATLSGTKSSSAGGKVVYKVYSDNKCEHLVKEAGEVTVSSGSVPASSEEELEGGKTYYWQAHYGGDSLHQESTSACGKEVLDVKAKTTLSTNLSGESKEGEELTVLEGSKAKDKATVEGTNSSTAEGKVLYKVYSDNKCEHLVEEAGEKSVSSGSGAASNEEELEGGKTYYWQATYKGDSLHQESKSACGKEILTIKAKTSLSTTLSGEGKEGDELTILEGSKVEDKATLSGTNSSVAGGTVVYKIYSDKECKDLVTSAGEETVLFGSVPDSSEQELEGGKSYYWQAHYDGDGLHQESTSACGSEILDVKAKTTIGTILSGESQLGSSIELQPEAPMSDTATVHGEHASTATGTVIYRVYSDNVCKELIAEAGEGSVISGTASSSAREMLHAGTYYWQAVYSGDALHQMSTSMCGSEVAVVKDGTELTTMLSGESESNDQVEVGVGKPITDQATLAGPGVMTAGGTVKYAVYGDSECHELVASAGEVLVSGEVVPSSIEEILPEGVYYWQATYSGDETNQSSTSLCGSEVSVVRSEDWLTTSFAGDTAGNEEEVKHHFEVNEGTPIVDTAGLHSESSATAGGTVKYDVYSDPACTKLVTTAGEVTVTGGTVPSSLEETLAKGRYYWQASYSGDENHAATTSMCGTEIVDVKSPTSLSTSLSAEGQTGETLTVAEATDVTDHATLSGTGASSAEGIVEYNVYSDSECKTLAASAGSMEVSSGVVPASALVMLQAGTYYWQASYSGDSENGPSKSACGAEVDIVKTTTELSTSLSSGEQTGDTLAVAQEEGVVDHATLSGVHSSTASGHVKYNVYSDSKCEILLAEAGEVTVSSGSVPASSEVKLASGIYYWQAAYSGDSENASSTSICGQETVNVTASALTDSLSSSEQSGDEIEVAEGISVSDTATLYSLHSAAATGKVKYAIYSDPECTDLVKEDGEVTVSKGIVPSSSPAELAEGEYYWQASYTGDAENAPAKSLCKEVKQVVAASLQVTPEEVLFRKNTLVTVDHPVDSSGKPLKEYMQVQEYPLPGDNDVYWRAGGAKKGAKNWPVAYVKGEKISLEARFAPTKLVERLVAKKELEEATIVGTMKVFGKALEVKVTFTNAELATQIAAGAITTGWVESSALPAEDGYERVPIKWSWTIKVNHTQLPLAKLGETTYNLYVLFRKPGARYLINGGQLDLTVLDIADKGNLSASRAAVADEEETITAVWGAFKNLQTSLLWTPVRAYEPSKGILGEGRWMRYWPAGVATLPASGKSLQETLDNAIPVPPLPHSLGGLLFWGDGECYSWAELLSAALSYQGITGKTVVLHPAPGLGYEDRQILANTWLFGKPGANGPNEVTRGTGVAAQGVLEPWAYFQVHAITLVEDLETGENGLFDPSYASKPIMFPRGTKPGFVSYKGWLEYEEFNLAGYCDNKLFGGKSCYKTTVGESFILPQVLP